MIYLYFLSVFSKNIFFFSPRFYVFRVCLAVIPCLRGRHTKLWNGTDTCEISCFTSRSIAPVYILLIFFSWIFCNNFRLLCARKICTFIIIFIFLFISCNLIRNDFIVRSGARSTTTISVPEITRKTSTAKQNQYVNRFIDLY